SGATSATYNVASAAPANSGSYDVVITPSCGTVVTTDAVEVTVNPTPTVTAITSKTACSGVETAPIALAGTPAGVTFDVTGGAAIGLADMSGVTSIPSFMPIAGGATITVTPMANGCAGTPVKFTYNVTQTPDPITVAASATTICSNGDAAQLTATGGTGVFPITVGNGTTLNTATGTGNGAYPTPYGAYYENGRQQYLIRASELTAAGIPAGPINAVSFNVAAVGTSGDRKSVV